MVPEKTILFVCLCCTYFENCILQKNCKFCNKLGESYQKRARQVNKILNITLDKQTMFT